MMDKWLISWIVAIALCFSSFICVINYYLSSRELPVSRKLSLYGLGLAAVSFSGLAGYYLYANSVSV